MFIKRKDWCGLNAKVKELEVKLKKLEERSVANSFCFGVRLTFPDYVRRTERAIKALIDEQNKPAPAKKRGH